VEALLPRIHARISLENENKQAITSVRAENIPSCELNSFNDEQAAQLKRIFGMYWTLRNTLL